MSPPCIAFFEGANGGATAKGVSRDEVNVVVQFQHTASNQKRGLVDCSGGVRDDDDHRDRACRAFMSYFNDRYQTYGRTVHLWSAHGELKPQWADIDAGYKPFAVAAVGSSREVKDSGSMSVGFIGQLRVGYPNLGVSYRQDLEDQAALAGSYICLGLAGRNASYAGDPTMRTRTRKFGLWESTPNQSDTRLLLQELKEGCDVRPYVVSQWQDPSGAAQMQNEQVTTVIALVGDAGSATITGAASRQGWFPEWVVPGGNSLYDLDNNFYGRTFPVQGQWANAFGLTFDRRREALTEQPWFRAYREGCPECPPVTGTDTYSVIMGYEQLAMLFYGIQAAGPRLTIQNFDRGMHAIPPRQSTDPFTPAAYFGPGNYSYLKDSAAIWWDPSGRPPGSAATGCWRLPQEGRRYRAGEWPQGDDLVKAPGPCQGEVTPS